jgi:UDP-N-acetylglucosamine--dolichyl-phosphate N-acetylglucosaminephosphotransferase
MKFIAFFSIIIAFLTVYYVTPWLIKYLKNVGMVVKDQHKAEKPLIPVSGGLVVYLGIFFGVMFIIFTQSFYYQSTNRLIDLLAFSASISMITFIGLADDLLIRKDNEASIGLKQWQKPLLTAVAAVPLMAVHVGQTGFNFPIFGFVDFGLFYTFLLIPIGFIGASNMVNLLEGFNGLGAGLGIIYLGNLSAYAYVVGADNAALIGFITCGALFAFLLFNYYPARIFPGDTLTYLLGGVLASMAILGNLEKAALIVSIPFFVEFALKLRGKLKKQTYGTIVNGKVKSFYNKVYSIPHFFTISGKYTEKQVVFFVWGIHLVCASLIWIVL